MDSTTEQTASGEQGGPRPISLVIPCKAEYVGLSRLLAGVVGARESLDEDVVADIKLVVTEACTCFVCGADSGALDADMPGTPGVDEPGSIRIDFYVRPDSWEIAVSDPDRRRRIPSMCRCDPMSETGLGLTIMKALVDVVEHLDTEAEGSVLRLVKRLHVRPDRAV